MKREKWKHEYSTSIPEETKQENALSDPDSCDLLLSQASRSCYDMLLGRCELWNILYRRCSIVSLWIPNKTELHVSGLYLQSSV